MQCANSWCDIELVTPDERSSGVCLYCTYEPEPNEPERLQRYGTVIVRESERVPNEYIAWEDRYDSMPDDTFDLWPNECLQCGEHIGDGLSNFCNGKCEHQYNADQDA